MVKARKTPEAPPPGVEGEDSDDAPEEFTAAEARHQAVEQRREEQKSRLEQQRQQRDRRRQRQQAIEAGAAALRSNDVESGFNDGVGPALDSRHGEEGADIDEDGGLADDFLPESILQAVAAQEEQAAYAAAQAAQTAALSMRAQRREAKRQRLAAVKESVVAVAVLPHLRVQQAASNFLKESLYGSRIRRSVDMLAKAKHQPSAKFA